jgi:hypothetical protein
MNLKKRLEKTFLNDSLAEMFMCQTIYWPEDAEMSDVTVSLVDQHGGEGEGDQYWTVCRFEADGEVLYMEFRGWYASYDGAEYTGYSFVEPKTKEVVVYV